MVRFSLLSLIAALLIVHTGTATAASVTQSVDLMIGTGGDDVSSLDLGINAMGFSDSDTTSLSGTLSADLTMDVCGPEAEITRLQFTGGSVSASDIAFRLPSAFPLVRIDGTGLGGSLTTMPGAGFVSDGTFATQDHALLINQGVLDISGALVQDMTVSLADEPIDFTAVSTGTIDLTEISSSGNDRTYSIRAVLPIDATTMTENPEATITAMGSVVALGEVTVTLGTPGDYNDNGIIDTADYTVWRDTLGQTGASLAADGNGNGQVDNGDYLIWRDNYGSSASASTASASAIPEPATMSLLLFALLAFSRASCRSSV